MLVPQTSPSRRLVKLATAISIGKICTGTGNAWFPTTPSLVDFGK